MFILKNLCAFASLRETLFIEVSVTGCLKLTVLGGTPTATQVLQRKLSQ
jgi:hypothetical protein